MSSLTHSPRGIGRARLALLPGLVFAVAILAAAVGLPQLPTWYAGLAKPAFAPPQSVLGPAWAALYGLMAAAAWRVAAAPGGAGTKPGALALFGLQLTLNALWVLAFFWLQKPVSALVIMAALAAAVGATLRRFHRIDAAAGWMLIPYLASVLFAILLNAAIVGLNP